ncbi:hypothetical protein JTB14_008295 [Gonioctena quinquepunctata]|nr:hypothetical protein JTB14_008295 [Gonioctena quinquepunctata]
MPSMRDYYHSYPCSSSMARASSHVSSAVCRKCNRNSVNYLKCAKCFNIYHLRCAKSADNVIVQNENVIICCDSEFNEEETSDGFFEALEGLSDDEKVDIDVFRSTLKQKDTIICELRGKIKIIQDHTELLNEFHNAEASLKQIGKNDISGLETKRRETKKAIKISNNMGQTAISVTKVNDYANEQVNKSTQLLVETVSAEILKAETEIKMKTQLT